MINSANISRQQRERDRTLAAFWRPSSVWAHACEPEGCHAPRAALESRSIFSSAPQTGVKKISLHQENFQLSVAATCIFFCGKKASRRNTRAACRPNTAISVAEAATLWVRARWVFSLWREIEGFSCYQRFRVEIKRNVGGNLRQWRPPPVIWKGWMKIPDSKRRECLFWMPSHQAWIPKSSWIKGCLVIFNSSAVF